MPDDTPPSHPHFTTAFTAIMAGEVQVAGLPRGAAGSGRIGHSVLSSLAALFTASPDLKRFLPPAPVSIAVAPIRHHAATYPAAPEYTECLADLLSIGD